MKKSKYSKELLTNLAQNSESKSEILRKLGLKESGGSHKRIKDLLIQYEIDTTHFLPYNAKILKNPYRVPKKTAEQILVKRPWGKEDVIRLRRALAEIGVPNVCAICGMLPMWMDKPLVLEIDHIDGDHTNCVKENLRYLCPNCHSQTDTFGNKLRV